MGFLTFLLQVRKTPEKTSPRKIVSTGGPLRDRRACYRLLHGGGLFLSRIIIFVLILVISISFS